MSDSENVNLPIPQSRSTAGLGDTDIVTRLRAASDQDAPLDYGEHWNLEEEAADEIEHLRSDADRLDWLEQHAWTTERECFDFVDAWRTPDGKRYSAGLRAAIDAAMMPNVELTGSGQVHRPESSDRRERG